MHIFPATRRTLQKIGRFMGYDYLPRYRWLPTILLRARVESLTQNPNLGTIQRIAATLMASLRLVPALSTTPGCIWEAIKQRLRKLLLGNQQRWAAAIFFRCQTSPFVEASRPLSHYHSCRRCWWLRRSATHTLSHDRPPTPCGHEW